MASLLSYVGSFAKISGTGTQDVTGIVDATNTAFTPKLVLFFGSDQTTTGFTDAGMPATSTTLFGQIMQGWDDGTNQACSATVFQDNTSADLDTNVAGTSDIRSIIRLNPTPFNISQSEGKISALASGQFTFNWTFQNGFNTGLDYLTHFIALGGSDLVWKFGEFARPSVLGAQTYSTGLSWTPTAILFMYIIGAGATTYGAGDNQGRPSFGWATTPALGQGALGIGSPAGLTTISQKHTQSAYHCILRMAPTTNNIDESASLLSVASGQFRLCWDRIGTGAGIYRYLAIGGVGARAFTFRQPASTGVVTISGLPITPQALILQSTGSVANESGVDANVNVAVGATDGTRYGSNWAGSLDDSAPTIAARYHADTNLLTIATPTATAASSTVNGRFTFSAFTSDGLTGNWTVTDGVRRQILGLALGGTPVTVTSSVCPEPAPPTVVDFGGSGGIGGAGNFCGEVSSGNTCKTESSGNLCGTEPSGNITCED